MGDTVATAPDLDGVAHVGQQNIIERLRRTAQEHPDATVTFHRRDGVERLTVGEVLAQATRRAGVLVGHGIGPGDRVALLGHNRPAWITWAVATWLAGGVLVPLPVPVLADPSLFARHIDRLVRSSDARAVVFEPELRSLVGHERITPWTTPGVDGAGLPSPPAPNDPAVIQFTSGSTADPRGVLLTHRAVTTAIDRSFAANEARPDDRMLSWLPFYHDWGLFGYLVAPLLRGYETHLLPTERFVADPVEWLRLAGRLRASYLPAPPSGWARALEGAVASGEDLDLSSVRYAALAAERIQPEVLDAIVENGVRFGLDELALSPAYGLAEAVLSVTATAPTTAAHCDEVDGTALTVERRAVPRRGDARVVPCGSPVPGTEIRIGDRPTSPLPDRSVGEIWVRSSSLMSGYVGSDPTDAFEDGWLRTGDLGYLAEGTLHVTGRVKDLIIVMGRNLAPEDLEWAAETVSGVRRGRSVAFEAPDSAGEAVVVVEPSVAAQRERLHVEVRLAVARTVGVHPTVVVAPRGTVEKTTSGKLRRSAMRQAYAAGTLTAPAGS